MDKVDYKKAFRELYQPGTVPTAIEVPQMNFIQVDGHGDPNEPEGEFQQAVEILYALSYTIKMSLKKEESIGYFEYVVPPLEGFWEMEGYEDYDVNKKSKFAWTVMIRQPEFVDETVFKIALELTRRKKPQLLLEKARFVSLTEGLCVHCMHLGSYDDEPATLKKMSQFIEANGMVFDLSEERKHHEIYLSDPRKGSPSSRKTILRYPVKRV